MHTIARKLRTRRNSRDFHRAFEVATPAVQQELLAAATRAQYRGV